MSASIQKKRRKRVEEVRVRRSTSRDGNTDAGTVVDLRTLVAQREIDRSRREQEQHIKQLHAQLRQQRIAQRRKKHSHLSFLSRMFHRRHTVTVKPFHRDVVEDASLLPEAILSSFERTNLQSNRSTPTVSVWSQTEQDEEEDVVESNDNQHQSFWHRPFAQPELDTVDPQSLPSFGFSFRSVVKPTLMFALLSLVVIVPANVSAMLQPNKDVANVVVESAEDAFTRLQEAGSEMQQFDFEKAQQHFADAAEAFRRTQDKIQQVNGVVLFAVQYLPVAGSKVKSGLALVTAGKELALAGEQLSEALKTMSNADIATLSSDEDTGLTALLVIMRTALAPTAEHVRTAVEHLNRVSVDVVPEQVRDVVREAQKTLPAALEQLEEAQELSDALLGLLGHKEKKRYLVLFQNNYELRPTGGFIGSVAVVDIQNGVVTGLDIPSGGVYDIAGQIEEKIVAPGPLQLVNPRWNLQDANWFPHFPTTAEKVQWFYSRSRSGTTVDGVITLVPRVVEQLLQVTGPIDMTDPYGVVITADNFYEEVQVRAEEKYDVTRESKKIISDLTPKLFNALFDVAQDPESLLQLLTVLQEAVDTKDILIVVNDPMIQQTLSRRDWSGEIKRTDRDYLAVINANIGGGKTDGVIDETIKHRAAIAADGSIIDTVTLTRVHHGDRDNPLQAMKNVDYVRFYVPQGSALLNARGFLSPAAELFFTPDDSYAVDQDLTAISGTTAVTTPVGLATNDEFEKTVFGGWVQTDVGSSSTVTIQYRLPFRITVDQLWNQTDRYSLLVQKQPGSWGTLLTHDLVVPSTMVVKRRFPETYDNTVQEVLNDDLFGGVILQRAK